MGMLTSSLDYIKSLVLTKYLGRVIILVLAMLSGWLLKAGVDPATCATWIEATRALLEALAPVLIAWVLGVIRHKIALATPVK